MWTKERKIQEEMEMASATSVFAPGLSIIGDIEATSDIRIEGDICGNVVTKKKVIVGVSGKVKGDIHASEICVMGEVLGDLYIQGLARFTAEATMKGTVCSEKIGIEAGADVELTVSKFNKAGATERSAKSQKGNDPNTPRRPVEELMKMD
ncbi:bactofilin family protein [Cyclobacterium xiamenense]|jgi:cytoskeletal protein CcmA (bactofilin family)|uniref:bactofilin family protein n=1 Tax=Cyclobacterium xiamenense TaxID=1297121 RepID=UPI0012B86251|nr:polymer-forming cytoskeletal protein [Cyclobacterium xiamenense]